MLMSKAIFVWPPLKPVVCDIVGGIQSCVTTPEGGKENKILTYVSFFYSYMFLSCFLLVGVFLKITSKHMYFLENLSPQCLPLPFSKLILISGV